MKSIKSELSALLSTAASRGWWRARLILLVVEARRESLTLFPGLTGEASLGTVCALLSSAGPVNLMNSAKSAVVVSVGTRASLASVTLSRLVDITEPVGGARGPEPEGLVAMGVLPSTILGLLGAEGRRGDGCLPEFEGGNFGELSARTSSLFRRANFVTTGLFAYSSETISTKVEEEE